MKIELYQVFGPRFSAGFLTEEGICTKAAPILKKFEGWTFLECRNSCVAHKWQLRGPIFRGERPSEEKP
jgi:hypothetical protein